MKSRRSEFVAVVYNAPDNRLTFGIEREIGFRGHKIQINLFGSQSNFDYYAPDSLLISE